jgi:hypothetical protein
LLVIVLLYVGLLASFSLNVSLLLRKPASDSAGAALQETQVASSSGKLITPPISLTQPALVAMSQPYEA